MIRGAFITQEKAAKIKGKSFGTGHYNPVQDEDGRWFISEIEGEQLGIKESEPLYRYTMEAHLNRASILTQLKVASDESGLAIPQDQFFNQYRDEIDYWLMNGGSGLIEIFTNDTSEWLDMREDEASLSPREFALKILDK